MADREDAGRGPVPERHPLLDALSPVAGVRLFPFATFVDYRVRN